MAKINLNKDVILANSMSENLTVFDINEAKKEYARLYALLYYNLKEYYRPLNADIENNVAFINDTDFFQEFSLSVTPVFYSGEYTISE